MSHPDESSGILLVNGVMKFITLFISTLCFATVVAAENTTLTVKSPEHRVSLLELYTSEGCSSCPPADKFLSSLHETGIKNNQLIPLAFHVTYWDYIGWKDPYASIEHDGRQRQIARFDSSRTIYTPQFVLNGSDYRQYNSFSENVRKVILQLSDVDIVLNAEKADQRLDVVMETDSSKSKLDGIAYYLVVYENNLVSDVEDGENEGRTLSHNYVVRKVHGPFLQSSSSKKASYEKVIHFEPEWKQQDLGVVAFAQNPATGKVLQAVELKLY